MVGVDPEWWAFVYDATCQQLHALGVDAFTAGETRPFTVFLHPADAYPRFLSPDGHPDVYLYTQRIWGLPVRLTPEVRKGQVRVRPS